jgi:hypothetical protein
MRTIKTGILLAALTLFAGLAYSAEVSGKWQSSFESPIGALKYTYDLKVDGATVSGKAVRELDGQKTEVAIREGKLSGENVSFVEPLEFDGQAVRIEYTGKISGDEMKLTRKVGDFATMQIVANREKSAAQNVDGEWQAEFDTQIGKQKYLFTLKADGSTVTGRANAEIGGEKHQTELKEGRLNGDEISFVEPLHFQGTDLRLEYKGKVSGDEMKLSRKVGDVATEELVAKRVAKGKQDATPTATTQQSGKGTGLQVVKVSSEETAGENARGANAVDGNENTIWHTEWQDNTPSHPHEIVIKLSAPARIKGFTYMPRQDESENGGIRNYEIYVSKDGNDFGTAVAKGSFDNERYKKTVSFEPKECQFIKLRALSEINDGVWASAAEIGVVAE